MLLAIAAFAVVAAPPTSLEAQTIPSPYRFIDKGKEISLHGGFVGGSPGRFGFGPAGGPSFGARFGIDLGNLVALEGLGSYGLLTRDVIDPTGEDGLATVSESDVQQLTIEARLRVNLTGRRTWNHVQPYIAFGLGLTTDFAGVQQGDLAVQEQYRFDPGSKFSVSGSGGLRVILGERLVGRVEGSLLLYQIDTPGGYSEVELGLTGVGQSEWINQPSLSIGLGYLF
jgi:hypothetical protein